MTDRVLLDRNRPERDAERFDGVQIQLQFNGVTRRIDHGHGQGFPIARQSRRDIQGTSLMFDLHRDREERRFVWLGSSGCQAYRSRGVNQASPEVRAVEGSYQADWAAGA